MLGMASDEVPSDECCDNSTVVASGDECSPGSVASDTISGNPIAPETKGRENSSVESEWANLAESTTLDDRLKDSLVEKCCGACCCVLRDPECDLVPKSSR